MAFFFQKYSDCFGRYYRFCSSRALVNNSIQFSDPLGAERFLNRLNVDENVFRSIILAMEGGLSDHDRSMPIKRMSTWLVTGRLSVVSVVPDDALSSPAHLRTLQTTLGKQYSFTSGSNTGADSAGTETFNDPAAAEAFIHSLNPSPENLDALEEIISVAQSLGASSTKANTVTPSVEPATPEARIARIGESIAQNDIAVVSATNRPPKSEATSDTEEDTANIPGNRPVEIAPASEPKAFINLVLSAWDSAAKSDKPCANISWKMTAPVSKNGVTGGSGAIGVEVPVGTSSSSIEITMPVEAQELNTAPVSTAAQATDYPIKIQYNHWEDDSSPAEAISNDPVTLDLTVVELPSWDNDKGLKARLANMGFATKDLEDAVKAYQYIYLKDANGSGQLADIKADLMTRHDGS